MKINPFQPVQQNPYRKQMERTDRLNDARMKRDQLEISPEALKMQKETKLEQDRRERVAELREQVQLGEYKINPKAIANKFYDHWNE